MKHEVLNKLKLMSRGKYIVAGVFVLFVITLVIFQLLPPDRSVVSYCKVYKEENAKLPHSGSDKYSVAIFTSSSNNYHNFAEAFGKLERVSPEGIRYDVRTLQSVTEKIDSDPSQILSASISGLSAESNVRGWTTSHCKD